MMIIIDFNIQIFQEEHTTLKYVSEDDKKMKYRTIFVQSQRVALYKLQCSIISKYGKSSNLVILFG